MKTTGLCGFRCIYKAKADTANKNLSGPQSRRILTKSHRQLPHLHAVKHKVNRFRESQDYQNFCRYMWAIWGTGRGAKGQKSLKIPILTKSAAAITAVLCFLGTT